MTFLAEAERDSVQSNKSINSSRLYADRHQLCVLLSNDVDCWLQLIIKPTISLLQRGQFRLLQNNVHRTRMTFTTVSVCWQQSTYYHRQYFLNIVSSVLWSSSLGSVVKATNRHALGKPGFNSRCYPCESLMVTGRASSQNCFRAPVAKSLNEAVDNDKIEWRLVLWHCYGVLASEGWREAW